MSKGSSTKKPPMRKLHRYHMQTGSLKLFDLIRPHRGEKPTEGNLDLEKMRKRKTQSSENKAVNNSGA